MIAWTVVARSDCLDIQILYGVNDRNQCGTNPPALVATSACIGACDTRGRNMTNKHKVTKQTIETQRNSGCEWREHDKTHRRVWNKAWAGDQFEIFTLEEFEVVAEVCGRLSIPLHEAED